MRLEYHHTQLGDSWSPWKFQVATFSDGMLSGVSNHETQETSDRVILGLKAQGYTERLDRTPDRLSTEAA